ncbi:MAG: penicillin-binding protein 2, partial [Thermodesulfobacteriota bacterium]|nr:penicillin-binding protein 2 [Thermodesulfobacteriota bacterium]
MRSSGFDPVSIEIFNSRLAKVTIIVIIIFSILILRLWFLQIVNGPDYRIQSENNRIHLQDMLPFRGMIFDR